MIHDHIKLRWLQDYLEGIEFLQQYHWQVYTDEDISESCIVEGSLYEVDLEYDILLNIQEYTRSSMELRRILLHWLQAANPKPHQEIRIQYKQIDTDRFDVLVVMTVAETQRDIECDPEQAEGWVLRNGAHVPIRLFRDKPDELVDLERVIHCSVGKQCAGL